MVSIQEELRELSVEKKARRLRILWPLIEAKLSEGVSHATVLELLNRNGFDLTEGTYKSYVHRLRKTPPMPTPKPVPQPITNTGSDNRPATFDYDPRGIPDLLK